MEDEATRRCSRPDGYNRLVERRRVRSETMRQERDDASGARLFFNKREREGYKLSLSLPADVAATRIRPILAADVDTT